MAEAVLAHFDDNPATTVEECDRLLVALLHSYFGEGRWKQIQAGFAKRSNVQKSLAWLKNRSRKVGEDDASTPTLSGVRGGQPPREICIGSCVQVHGLQSAEGQSLNGAFGTVASLDPVSFRCGVDIQDVGMKSIRRHNLIVTEPGATLPPADPCCEHPHEKARKKYTVSQDDLNAFFGSERNAKAGKHISKLLQVHSDSGDVRAMFATAHLYDQGYNVLRRDAALAREQFLRVAEHPEGGTVQVVHALRFFDGFFSNLAKASGMQSFPEAQTISRAFLEHVEFPKCSVKSHACLVIGEMYDGGDGLTQDMGKASKWIASAAELGHPEAQKKLASYHMYGDGVERSLSKSQEWTAKAAENGHPYSQLILASQYWSGGCKDLKVDITLANKWLHAAAHGGEPEAQYILGAHYGKGTLRCKRSDAWALYWYRKAGAKGQQHAIDGVQRMVSSSDKQKSEADEAYDSGDMAAARHLYGHALECAIGDGVRMKILLSSKSSTHLFMGDSQIGAEVALRTAEFCIRLDSQWAEGYLRGGFALLALGRHDEAKQMLSDGALLDPKNTYFKTGLVCSEKRYTGRLSEIIPRCKLALATKQGSQQAAFCEDPVTQVMLDWITYTDEQAAESDRISLLTALLLERLRGDLPTTSDLAALVSRLPKLQTSSASIGEAQEEIHGKCRGRGGGAVTEADQLKHQELLAQIAQSIKAINRKLVKDAGKAVSPANLERIINCRSHCGDLYETSLFSFPAQVSCAASMMMKADCLRATCFDLGGEYNEALAIMNMVLDGPEWCAQRNVLSSDPERKEVLAEAHRSRGLVRQHLGQDELAVQDAKAAVAIAEIDLGLLKALHSKAMGDQSVCKHCDEAVPQTFMRRHLKKDCPGRVHECECGDRMCFREYAAHRADDCALAQAPCPQCLDSISRNGMDEHLRSRCPLRTVLCPSPKCQWQGSAEYLTCHMDICPFARCTCPYCFEEVDQGDMSAHICRTVQITAECLLCSEPFQKLLDKGCPPSVLLLGSKQACCHGSFICISCACKVKAQADAELGASCPLCRMTYDAVTVLPLNLIDAVPVCTHACGHPGEVAAPKHRGTRPRVPKAEDCYVSSVHWVSPLDVRFTHNNVKEEFKPFTRSGGEVVENKGILTSLEELIVGSMPLELDMLEVVLHDGHIYVAGTGNRRLCMWRLLAIYIPTRFRQIKVRFKDRRFVRDWDKKLSTPCDGRWVEIRYKRYVGLSKDGDEQTADPGVVWPEARDLLSPFVM